MKGMQLAVLACGLLTALSVIADENRNLGTKNATVEVLNRLHFANQHVIDAGHQAAKKARDSSVKKYADTVVRDHSNLDKKVASLAKKNKVDLETELDRDQETHEAMANLQQMGKGHEWDTVYLNAMVSAHDDLADDVGSALPSIKDPETKRLASEALPTIKNHAKQAQELLDQLHSTRIPAGEGND